MKTSTRRNPLKIWIQAITVFGLVIFGGLLTPLTSVENMVLDLWTCLAVTPRSPDDILVVAVDEPSFQELGRQWPWPRSLHARLVDTLTQAGAKAIVFDIVFSDPSNPDDDAAFARAIGNSKRVVLASTLDVIDSGNFFRKIMVQPMPELREDARVGLAMITPDPDGIVRRFHLNVDGHATLPATSMRLTQADPPTCPESGLIRFAGPSMTVPHLSYYQVIDQKVPLPPQMIEGKTVFVGKSSAVTPDPATTSDSFRTPYTSFDGHYMAGVEIHANVLNTILHGASIQDASLQFRLGLILACLGLTSWLLSGQSAGYIVLGGSSLSLSVFGGSYAGYSWFGVWFPPVLLSFGILLLSGWTLAEGFVTAARQRAWIRNAFGKYISPQVVEMLVDKPELLALGGTEVDATVLFLDLEGFTTLSESLLPAELVALLSEIFAPMAEIIKAEGGTLDKFIGDAIMAFWGAPVPMRDHALRACRAALTMQATLQELSAGIERRGGPKIRARIGIHSGALVVGNIGSKEQFNYTCLGDTVNLASRIEASNKLFGTKILLSAQTATQLGHFFLLRPLDRVQVKGRMEPVQLVELIGPAEVSPPQWLQIFEDAWNSYARGEFKTASKLFSAVLAVQPEDAPANVLRLRCEALLDHSPTPWSGVWSLQTNQPATFNPHIQREASPEI